MKAFRFSLEALLTLRERLEQTALGEYGKVMREEQRLRMEKEQAEQELKTGWDMWNMLLGKGADIQEINQVRNHCSQAEQWGGGKKRRRMEKY